MVPARRLPGGLDAPGCLFTYAGFQHCGGQMPESPHKGRDHRLGPLLLSNPRGGAGGLALGRSEAAGWSHGTALGLGSVLRWGDPGVGSSSQPGASALCPTDCWVSAHRLLLPFTCLLASVSPPGLTPSREGELRPGPAWVVCSPAPQQLVLGWGCRAHPENSGSRRDPAVEGCSVAGVKPGDRGQVPSPL